jgi:hypothetical protein
MHTKNFKFRYVLLATVVLLVVLTLIQRPSNDRIWSPDQAVLASAEIDGNVIHIHNVRNFTYRSDSDYDIHYEDRTYNLNDLQSLWFIVEPFSWWKGPAHTFLSFGFKDGRYIAISVEIRKERGEAFSALYGFFNQYELMYVVGDERDLIQLRTNFRKDDVYLYPARVTNEKLRELFLSMLERVNQLRSHPEFYNTLTNTCTTNIVRHINAIAPHKVPFSFKVLFPAYSDRLAYDLGLLDTTLPFDEVREHYHINERAVLAGGKPEFSALIRKGL